MNGMNEFLVAGYVVGLSLMWGYALLLLFEWRMVSRAERAREQEQGREDPEPANSSPEDAGGDGLSMEM